MIIHPRCPFHDYGEQYGDPLHVFSSGEHYNSEMLDARKKHCISTRRHPAFPYNHGPQSKLSAFDPSIDHVEYLIRGLLAGASFMIVSIGLKKFYSLQKSLRPLMHALVLHTGLCAAIMNHIVGST